MDKELKAKWVAALRSGEYKQGIGSLYVPQRDAYCCLGVLCDIVQPDTIDRETGYIANIASDETNNAIDAGEEILYLPNSVQRVAGLAVHHQAELARMNDCKRRSFAQIADYIEKNL